MKNNRSLIRNYNLKDKLCSLSKDINITKWDLSATVGSDTSVQIDNGETKQLKASQKSSITIRVWNSSNAVGITSTSDLSESGLRKALDSALLASAFGNINDSPEFSPKSQTILPNYNRPIKDRVGINILIKSLIEAESCLLNSNEAIKSVPYNGFAESDFERLYINSEGASRYMQGTQASLYLYARAIEDGRKARSSGSIKIGYGVEDIDIESCIKEASLKTLDHLNYKPIKTGKYLICFKPEAFLDLIISFSNLYNARSIIDGISLSTKNSIGEKLSSNILCLIDDGLHEANYGASTFDGEGTPTQNIEIIKNGVLKSFIHSEATARIFGTNPTGHAGIGAKVSVSPDWPVIYKAKDELAKCPHLSYQNSKDTFILVENLNALHAGVKASQGSFSLPFDGWIVKNGIKTSIESATIAGDFKSMLKNIIQIEDEPSNTHQGVSPHIWVNELTVTGDK